MCCLIQIVLVHSRDLPELISSEDGKVQGAVIKTVTKGGSISMASRPIQHLYPLEICKDADFKETNKTGASEDICSPTQSTKYERPV